LRILPSKHRSEKVELTTAKAKELEKPVTYAQTELPSGTFEISGRQPTPAGSTPPQTEATPPEIGEESTDTAYMDRELSKAFKKLPKNYKIVQTPSGKSFYGQWDGRGLGLPIVWNPKHGVWMPPGFVYDHGDHEHIVESKGTNRRKAHWHGRVQQWINTSTGEPIGYEQ
jgi:hypothetical protein